MRLKRASGNGFSHAASYLKIKRHIFVIEVIEIKQDFLPIASLDVF
jgi:hypothetical protein